jgi:pSer/pThr/pTyr-binding forkhead associated (FHA) protein
VVVALPSRATQRLCVIVALVHGVPLAEKELGEGAHVLGRGQRARVRITNDTVSALHCELRVTSDGVSVRDLHSTNGTSVHGTAVAASAPTAVFDGDEIALSSEVRVRVVRGAGLRAAGKSDRGGRPAFTSRTVIEPRGAARSAVGA